MLKKVSQLLGVQSVGILSNLLIVYVISNYQGVSAQGEFTLYKSWFDIINTICCFGFPQGLVYILNKKESSYDKAAIFCLIHSSLSILVSILLTYSLFSYYTNGSLSFDLGWYITLSLVTFSLVYISIFRGVFLTLNNKLTYSLLTITFPVCLLLFLIVIMVGGWFDFKLIYSLSAIASILLIFTLVRSKEIFKIDIPFHKYIFIYKSLLLKLKYRGGNVLLQGVFYALVPLCMYKIAMSIGDGGIELVGQISISVYVLQVFLVPANMLTPFFFNWLCTKEDFSLFKNVSINTIALSILMVVLISVFIAYVVEAIVLTILGEVYLMASNFSFLITLFLSVFLFNKVAPSILMAKDKYSAVTFSAFIKFLIFTICAYAYVMIWDGGGEALIVSFIISEFIQLIILLSALIRDRPKW